MNRNTTPVQVDTVANAIILITKMDGIISLRDAEIEHLKSKVKRLKKKVKKLKNPTLEMCLNCDGQGVVRVQDGPMTKVWKTCPACSGTGSVEV